MSGLSTVAKNHPNSRGLSMAIVTASFGLSGLTTGNINIRAMYLSFGVLLSTVGLFSAYTLRIIDTNAHVGVSAVYDSDDEDDETTALLSQSAILEPSDKLSQMDRMKTFLKDHSSWWYFLAFILLAGPGEVFTNNLGTMFQALQDSRVDSMSASSQVSLFALSSTCGRLLFGALCDVPSKSPITARMLILILTATLLSFGFIYLSLLSTASTFWVSSVAVGAGYGGLFTVYPAIISIVWGTENFATFWGCLATAPAVGSTSFGILYAKMYDRVSTDQGNGLCRGRECFGTSTLWFAGANLVGVGILMFATVVWRRRFSTES
ncbi:Probable transporter MCH1 [Taphrina deformans PYCC 5710]|uniref:Probable transporter MCH1 n=1 Tax=Taphrina deformans (strain PYCC 5710 / ATCC 11124 / CBS 356.35 / IMI 108563 / JCM 9778 / NBRC 8474) TaxID=1097556 RepID=R4XDC6_TAPDE|nr:Probable transporter MCH1 [Taphrina deformans PYCC 5710]|eukprot:CCG83610.1 Probable transporter MCH1 [Taphrina deformans PYCC 5710]